MDSFQFRDDHFFSYLWSDIVTSRWNGICKFSDSTATFGKLEQTVAEFGARFADEEEVVVVQGWNACAQLYSVDVHQRNSVSKEATRRVTKSGVLSGTNFLLPSHPLSRRPLSRSGIGQ